MDKLRLNSTHSRLTEGTIFLLQQLSRDGDQTPGNAAVRWGTF